MSQIKYNQKTKESYMQSMMFTGYLKTIPILLVNEYEVSKWTYEDEAIVSNLSATFDNLSLDIKYGTVISNREYVMIADTKFNDVCGVWHASNIQVIEGIRIDGIIGKIYESENHADSLNTTLTSKWFFPSEFKYYNKEGTIVQFNHRSLPNSIWPVHAYCSVFLMISADIHEHDSKLIATNIVTRSCS